jgi:DNA-binding IclR family transcriptional regulator
MKTVNRAIEMLQCFTTERPQLAVSELATMLSVHKSIASRLAATLRDKKFLQLDPMTRRYRVGVRLFELGQLFSQSATLNEVATPYLRALARKVGHASHVCVLDGQKMLTVSCVESKQQLQVAVQIGERRPVHATAVGKLFLAYGPSELVDTLSPGGQFPKIGPRTIQSRQAMKNEIAAIRRAGIARNREESARGVGAVAAPVFGPNKEIVASVSVVFPLFIVSAAEFERIGVEVRETANRITRALALHGASRGTKNRRLNHARPDARPVAASRR